MSDTPTILAQAQAKLTESLAQLPEGKKGALAAVVTDKGARVAFVSRLGDDWIIDAYAEKPWGHPVTYGADVLFTW